MEIFGRIKEVKEAQIFEKVSIQKFVLDCTSYDRYTGEEYLNFVELQVFNNKVDFTGFATGQRVKATFNVQGRFFQKEDGTEGFSQNLVCYKVEKV